MEDHPKPQENTPPKKRRDAWSLLASQLGLLSSPIAPDVAEAATRNPSPDESPGESPEEQPVVEETVAEIQTEQIVSTSLFDDQGDELPSVLWQPKKVTPGSPSASPSKNAEIKSPFAGRQPISPEVSRRRDAETKPEPRLESETEEPIPVSAFSSGVGRQNRDRRSRGRDDQKENVRACEPESPGKRDSRNERKPRREPHKPVEREVDTSIAEVMDEVSFEPKVQDRSRRRRGRKEEPVPESFEEQLLTPVFDDEFPEEKPRRSPRRRREEHEEIALQRTVRSENKKETTASVPDFSQLHKKIPSWDDAIGMIIDSNMERSPNRGSSRRGHSRGRRR